MPWPGGRHVASWDGGKSVGGKSVGGESGVGAVTAAQYYYASFEIFFCTRTYGGGVLGV